MKAVVFRGTGDTRLDTAADPSIDPGRPGGGRPVRRPPGRSASVPDALHALALPPRDATGGQEILLSDACPTTWSGAERAEVGDGDVVAVRGCGPKPLEMVDGGTADPASVLSRVEPASALVETRERFDPRRPGR